MGLKNAIFSDKKRYITGISLIIALTLLLWINNSYLIWFVLGIAFFIGIVESLRLFKCPNHPIIFLFAILIWIGALFNARPLESGIFFTMLLAGFLAYKQSIESKYLLAFIYPTLPFLILYATYRDFGIEAIIWLIATIAICDSAAYFGGRAFGKTPFSPTSPKKTIEGVVVGVIFAVSIGSILGIGVFHQNFFVSLFISLIVAISGVLGDLYESYLKRQAGLKDSGNILPGHGGILDRFDAVLFGGIAMHFLLYFFSSQPNQMIVF